MQPGNQLLLLELLVLWPIVLGLPMLDSFRGYYGKEGQFLAETALVMWLGFLATTLI